MILGIFGMFPIFMELTLHSQKTSFLVFWTFRELRDSKKGKVREHRSEFSRRTQWAENKDQKPNQLGDRGPHAASEPGRVGPPLLGLVTPPPSLDLKTPIKEVPRRSLEGAPPKHRNTERETWSCRLEGENSGGALPAWSPSSPTTSPPFP